MSSTRLDINEIKRYIPHRYPFLLIDEIVELEEGKRGVGIKNVTINEPFFIGHFPQFPIMPGVLIIESLAQVTAVVFSKTYCSPTQNGFDTSSKKIGVLSAVNNMKFLKPVVPGNQLRLEINVKTTVPMGAKIIGVATVLDKMVAKGELLFSIIPNPEMELKKYGKKSSNYWNRSIDIDWNR